MNAPLVSVVMPVYNAEKTLRSALLSVLDQSVRDLELILVDDGSTDRSFEIASSYSDPRIRIFRQENRGTAEAQNTGFSHLRGQYIALHDSDDLWHVDKLKRHLEHFQSRPEVGVSYSYSQFMRADGVFLPYLQKGKVKEVTVKDLLCRYPVGNGSNAVMRKEVLVALFTRGKPVNSGQAHDIEMWMWVGSQTAWIFEGIPEALTYYRLSAGTYSSDPWKKLESFEKALTFIGTYAPEVIAKYGAAAHSYHDRYISRRAFSQGDASIARHFFKEAIIRYPRIMIEEPSRTLATGLAVFVMSVLPHRMAKALAQWIGG